MENISEKHEGNNANTLLGVVASNEKVLICNNCKEYWIAPKERCDCGSTTLTATHLSNAKLAKKFC